MSLLQNDWAYTVDASEMNPNDPVVNTPSEYMFQMATIASHTLTGTQTVTLPETVTTDDGTVFAAAPTTSPSPAVLERLRPHQPDRREGSRAGLERHDPRAHRRARRRQRDGLCPADGPRDRRPRGRPGSVLILAGLGIVWAARPVTESATEKATKPATVPATL